jgi:hypothetical protein
MTSMTSMTDDSVIPNTTVYTTSMIDLNVTDEILDETVVSSLFTGSSNVTTDDGYRYISECNFSLSILPTSIILISSCSYIIHR